MDFPASEKPSQTPVRRYPRMVAECVVAYRRRLADGSESEQQFARTHSIGLGGLMFEAETPIEIGQSLRLEVILGELNISALGEVAYVESRDETSFQIGVKFSEISENDRDRLLGAYLQREYRITPL